MAFPKIEDDMNIIQALGDRPNALDGLSAAELKERFDQAGNIIKAFINDVFLPALYNTEDNNSGADNIGATSISDLDGETVQALIESVRDKLKSTTTDASGAGFVGAATIDGLVGNNVQSILQALKTYVDNKDTEIGTNYVSKTEMTNTRKIDSNANFTGSWFGIPNPTFADPGIANVVSQHTTQLAVVGEKKIYARDYGVKLDGVTDDTVALNNFFSHWGEGELIVDNGVALVSGQLNVPGVWRPDTGNSSVKRLTFVRASIKYVGPANKAVMQFYNHFTSIIDGVAITRDSNPTYINFAGFWYSKFVNFDVPKLTFGYNNADITASLLSASSFVNVIEKGYVNGPMEFYGVGITGSSFINSMRINDVLVDGRNANAYNIKFYGTSFENFSFNGCDLSYATSSVLYIDTTQTTSSIHFDNCYFDTAIPMIELFNYKGAIPSISNTREAAGTMAQAAFCKTSNLMTGHRLAGRGHEPNNLPKGLYNYMFNGDLYLTATNGTWFIEQNVQGGAVAAKSWVTNANTIRGNALNVVFSANGQQQIYRGMNVPHTGVYTCGLRIKKNSGNTIVQISYASTNATFDLSKIPDGEEAILSTHGVFRSVAQGTQAAFSIVCLTTNAGANIDILEIFMIDGTYSGFNLPLHPKAQIYNARTTAQRPVNPIVGETVFDTTLNKPIWCKSVGPVVWVDATGATV